MLLLLMALVAFASAILESGDVLFDKDSAYKFLPVDPPKIGKEAAQKLLVETQNYVIKNYNEIPLTKDIFKSMLVSDSEMDYQIFLEVGSIHRTGEHDVMEGLREMYQLTGPLCTREMDKYNLTDTVYPFVDQVYFGQKNRVAEFTITIRFCTGRLVALYVQVSLERAPETQKLIYLIKYFRAKPKHGDLPRNGKGKGPVDFDYLYVEDRASSAIETAVLDEKFIPILYNKVLSKRRDITLQFTKREDYSPAETTYTISGTHGTGNMTLDSVQDFFKRVSTAVGELQKLKPDITYEEVSVETIRSSHTVLSETTKRQIHFQMWIHKKAGAPYFYHISTMSHWDHLWNIYGLYVTEKVT